MSFSLSNARERPPTRAVSGKQKKKSMLARSLDLPPDREFFYISQEFNFFRLCSPDPELRAFAVVRYVCRARSVAPREPHAMPFIANASRACVSDVALLCLHPCVGLNARVRAVRAPARDCSSHTRVFVATCTYQFTIHLITNKPHQTHTSDEAPHTGSRE